MNGEAKDTSHRIYGALALDDHAVLVGLAVDGEVEGRRLVALAGIEVAAMDDKLVAALETALANPMVLAFLLSLLAGEDEVKPQAVSAEESEAMDTISDNAEVVGAIFSLAKVD